jgi:hypothetical protein
MILNIFDQEWIAGLLEFKICTENMQTVKI